MIDTTTGLYTLARQCPSPNCDQRPEGCVPDLIVLHNITLPPYEFGGNWIDQLFTNQLDPQAHPFFATIQHLRVASHILIRREGEVVQYVPFHQRAFHAGVSRYQGRERCNDFSIGIEIEGTDFEPFTAAQYQMLERLLLELVQAYPTLSLEHITGHEHIAPGRKTDPGPYFDWQRLSERLGVKLPADAGNVLGQFA
ncbi:MAG: 1,6-anhydro-N-acetylmuramyl-L-alanine amidase AmpD [Thiofilum sp.]|uniref:1,6-anhydro-N-acetylmuramyl-L-alanine amidase AmpD n=1 Tax=Thiofilum sp. TaxID=2212733 RepID=UPI0025F86C2F|nr:1,6-anhydro-N-acetylmuramyl-L-alanine amidase AmpD [Thiofilum sp.]MBK8453698.1 1,6-anhydro-N-acetylmuramyl-L-alanine amidase AmpD [Thiofilum sp.]